MKNSFEQIVQQAQKVQEALKKAQAELAVMQVTGESGAGMVKATVNGHYRVLNLEIEEELYKENKNVLCDLIVAAINDGMSKVQQQSQDKMRQYAMGFGSGDGKTE